jgi:RimJ/RimL family protein N-acetyltransferase
MCRGCLFDLQPTLENELLSLRPLRPEDFHDLYAVASDPLIWEQHPSSGRYQDEVFRKFFRGMEKIGGIRSGTRHDRNGRESLVCRIAASALPFTGA